MPNRLEIELAKDAVNAVLDTSIGKSVAHKILSEVPLASSLLAHEPSSFYNFEGTAKAQMAKSPDTFVKTIDFKGWTGCFELKNEAASAVVVPHTGRIASFQLTGGENVFWENAALSGKPPGGTGEWMNFGGDKVWPAPQSNWTRFQKGDWPPPQQFDQMPMRVQVHPDGVTTTSDVHPESGLRLIRNIKLNDSTMRVTSTFEKVEGAPVDVSVWSVAQMRDPRVVAFPLRSSIDMPEGFKTQMGSGIPSFKSQNGIASFARDIVEEHKVGTPSNRLLWVGDNSMLRMKSMNTSPGTFPDGGSWTEIYTNNKVPYIELETLGPIAKLSQGDRASHQVQYQLFPTTSFSLDF